MKLSFRAWVRITCAVLFSVWLGVPSFNKWQADKLVDKLCAKDGGVKIFETVTLPRDRFNQLGQFEVHPLGYLKQGDEYYLTHETIDIKGKSSSSSDGALAIFELRFQILRLKDKKILGEMVSYARTGGDSPGPWFPSSYSCPQHPEFESNIFIKSESSK